MSAQLARKLTLPKYAYQEQSPHAGGERDLIASFRDDDGGTISVALEFCEGAMLNLEFSRSGLGESRFTKSELAKVLELSAVLFAAVSQ